MNWPTKKLEEMACVVKFLGNATLKFDQNDILPNKREDDIVDVCYKNKKFQVVKADFKFQKLIGITPVKNGIQVFPWRGRDQQDIWRDYILCPMKKKNKYGKAANDVVLLIDSFREPPWIEEQLDIFKKFKFKELKALGFDKIYLVCPGKNIKIYP